MSLKSLDSVERFLNVSGRGQWIVECYVLGDLIQIKQSWFRPDQSSHFFIFLLASACENVRFSRIARSPRDIPSRICILLCMNS